MLQILAGGKVHSEQNTREEQLQREKKKYVWFEFKTITHLHWEINQWENPFCSVSPSVNKLIEHRARESLGGLFSLLSAQQSSKQLQDPPLHKPGAFRQGDHSTETKEFLLQEHNIFEIHFPASEWGLRAVVNNHPGCWAGLVPWPQAGAGWPCWSWSWSWSRGGFV